MPQTAKGIVYPDSSGSTRLWEHLENLAETADSAIDAGAAAAVAPTDAKANTNTAQLAMLPKATAAGTATVSIAANSRSGYYDVTFPAGRFTAVPIVLATAANSVYNTATRLKSTTGARVDVNHIDGTLAASATTASVDWYAIQS